MTLRARHPRPQHRSASGGISRRLLRDSRAMGASFKLGWYAFLEVLTLIRWVGATLLSILGVAGLDKTFASMRRNAERQRVWASEAMGQRLSARYESAPGDGSGRGLAPLGRQLQDHSRARDLDWHIVNPLVGGLSAAIPFGVALSGVNSFFGHPFVVIATVWDLLTAPLRGDFFYIGSGFLYWYFNPVLVLFGFFLLFLAPVVARLTQRLHARWVKFMLATDVSETLAERVASLTETRKTALELQEAEIRRIERDLHDGAQARLVTMGMSLTQASRLLEHDPDGARAMLDAAKGDSAEALRELRTLVRGIRPPILADRGLVEAVRSLAKASPIETRVVSDLTAQLVPTLETALYFAVAELLTNAAKHSCATEVVIELSATQEAVTVAVTDNGIGGARLADGGGLAGLTQRLAPFDGTFEFVSPVGGPTVAKVTAPLPA